jgi:hypothetical protein
MNTTINNIVFEWDEEKNRINLQKHRVDFTDAAQIFFDENRIERRDIFHSDDEDRWQVIGKVNDILFVIYTERGEKIRLISARKANKTERRIYYGNGNLRFT